MKNKNQELNLLETAAVALWVTVLFLLPIAAIVWLLKFILQTIGLA